MLSTRSSLFRPKRADRYFLGTHLDSTPFAIPRVKTHDRRNFLFGGIILDSSRALGSRMQFVKEKDETRWRNASDKVWIKGFVAQEDVVAANRR